MEKSERKQISQPGDWWPAFAEQAKRNGQTGPSEYLGACGVKCLDADLREGLAVRRGRGRVKTKSGGK